MFDLSKQSETEPFNRHPFPNKTHVFSDDGKHYQQAFKAVRQLSLRSAVKFKFHCEKMILLDSRADKKFSLQTCLTRWTHLSHQNDWRGKLDTASYALGEKVMQWADLSQTDSDKFFQLPMSWQEGWMRKKKKRKKVWSKLRRLGWQKEK